MKKTVPENFYITKGKKKLRLGYTTGSCAAAAARGAVAMLLSGEKLSFVTIMTPGGISLHLPLEEVLLAKDRASCGVRKDAGDDPDSTDGVLIAASVSKRTDKEIVVEGGQGIGRVERPGLSCPPGEAAINPVPKRMIINEAQNAAAVYGYEGGLTIVISCPEGEAVALKTFNPRLGIVGGISILGTTGIVEPMSERALIESIRTEMRQRIAMGEEYLIAAPGNYGVGFLKDHMNLPSSRIIKCSNYIGDTIDMAVELGAKGLLFAAHIGKFCKVASGIMNTHSREADGRMESLAACAVRAGAPLECIKSILEAATTEDALSFMKEYRVFEPSMDVMLKRIQFYLDQRSCRQILSGAMIFSNLHGYLGGTCDSARLKTLVRPEYF